MDINASATYRPTCFHEYFKDLLCNFTEKLLSNILYPIFSQHIILFTALLCTILVALYGKISSSHLTKICLDIPKNSIIAKSLPLDTANFLKC